MSLAAMLGFTVPLLVLLSVEALVALLLLAPKPLPKPAVYLCMSTKQSVGLTIIGTLSTFLLVSLASPFYDLYEMQRRQGTQGDIKGRRY